MIRRTLLALLVCSMVALPALAQDITGPQAELPKEKLVIVTKDGVRHDFNVEMAIQPSSRRWG